MIFSLVMIIVHEGLCYPSLSPELVLCYLEETSSFVTYVYQPKWKHSKILFGMHDVLNKYTDVNFDML